MDRRSIPVAVPPIKRSWRRWEDRTDDPQRQARVEPRQSDDRPNVVVKDHLEPHPAFSGEGINLAALLRKGPWRSRSCGDECGGREDKRNYSR